MLAEGTSTSFEQTALDLRPRSSPPCLEPPAPVDRVARLLGGAWSTRSTRGHVVIRREIDVARLKPLGGDNFALSFKGTNGRWGPMLLIDTLEELVAHMVAALAD